MAYRERVNKKTGKKEYKYRYYFISDGKKRDSETAWFDTKEKAKREGEKLKALKERMERDKTIQRRDKMLISVFEEFISYLEDKSERTNNTTVARRWKIARVMYNRHLPIEIQRVRVSDIDRYTFRKWLSMLNDKEDIGGAYIRDMLSVMQDFNIWMSSNGYYIENSQIMEEEIALTLNRTRLKDKMEHNRELKGERNIIDILELERITGYYERKGLGEFRNFYYYTMYYLLFFSGMRLEEMVALQWKSVYLENHIRKIHIQNAIPRLENRKHARKRTEEEIFKVKTKRSERIIPIFDFYYDLLVDYRESYKYQYGLSEEEIKEAYMFPSIVSKSPYIFVNANSLWREFKKTIKELGEKNTDLQMFRHSCATFLILPPPNGLGFTEENVKDYFGHIDTNMLNRVYATINIYERSDRLSRMFDGIYNPVETDQKTIEEQMKKEMLRRIYGDNKREKESARKGRIFAQIDKVVKLKKECYYYREKDKYIIDDYIKENGKKIKFIMEG